MEERIEIENGSSNEGTRWIRIGIFFNVTTVEIP